MKRILQFFRDLNENVKLAIWFRIMPENKYIKVYYYGKKSGNQTDWRCKLP